MDYLAHPNLVRRLSYPQFQVQIDLAIWGVKSKWVKSLT